MCHRPLPVSPLWSPYRILILWLKLRNWWVPHHELQSRHHLIPLSFPSVYLFLSCMFWLVLCQLHTRQRYLERMNLSWENIPPPNQPIRKASVCVFSWLILLGEGPAHLNVDTLGWLSCVLPIKKALKSKPIDNTSPWPWHQSLLPGSCSAWVLSMTYCHGSGLCCESIRTMKLSLSMLLRVMVFLP